MKNKFQSNLDGQMLDGGSIEHPLSIHSASIGTRWKPRGMQLICTLVLLFTFAIGQMWAGVTIFSSVSQETTDGSWTITGSSNSASNQSNVVFPDPAAETGFPVGKVTASTAYYCKLSSSSDKGAKLSTAKRITIGGLSAGDSIVVYWFATSTTSGKLCLSYATGASAGSYIEEVSLGTIVTKQLYVTSFKALTATDIDHIENGYSGSAKLAYISSNGPSPYVYAVKIISGSVTKHTVTYALNGGTGTTPTQADVAENAKFTLHDGVTNITAPNNKDFAGWSDGTTTYAGGAEYTMGTSNVILTAQWVDHVAKYTVKYMDGTTELGSEEVNVGSTPAGLANDPTKDCYTFAAWSPALNTVSGDENDVVEVSATWTPNYFTESVDFEEGGSSAVSGVASKNIVASNAGSYDGGKAEENWAYKGWKIKSAGATVKVLVQANKKVTFKFGYLAATAHVAISGDATNYSVTGASNVEDDPLKYTTYSWIKDYDALYTFTTGDKNAAVIKALTVQDTYTATRVDGKSDGAGTDANVLETTLPTPATVSGWTFTGWVANQDVENGEGTKAAGTVLAAGTYTLLANTTFTAQWAEASSTYDITYVSAHGTAPAADNAASVVLAELDAEGWAHKGWTANADVTVDAATVEAGTLIANGKTAILESNVTFTAVWKEIFTVTFDSKGGSAVDPIDVEDGATLAAAPADPTKDDYIFLGWSETDGGDVVADITAITISGDKTFYAKWKLDVQVSEIVFSNSFKGWIVGSTVTVFYMAGESAPTITSYAGKNLKAEGGVVISGDKIIATGTDDSEIEFALTMTEVTPLATTGAQTFDGTEGYIKTRHAWTSDRKWKMSKYAEDGRVAKGETSMYIFLGAAESVTLDWGAQKGTNDVAVYVNGTFVKNIGKNNNSAIALSNGNNMVAMYSLQTSGDIWLNGLTVAPWVPVTAVALKEGEDAISSKEIWESTSFTLTAEVTPDNASNKTITWTSSNEAVATVENGVVTGVAASADPVTITASTVDGVNATCVVTVTTAPQPSADPVITAQPQSANYYEGATIAALEVVATGESLTYQWYLGSEAIEGAIAATYQPTVSAIGSYVYHCVVTNTEAGNLPTSLASDNATITISDDPAAIKLLDGEGNVNTANFTTGVTAGTVNFDDADHKCASFGSTGGSIVGLTGINKVVAYNATTTQTKVKFVLYNTNSSAKELYLQKVLEGATEAVTETISVPSKELYETQYYTYNSSDLRSFYVTVNSTNIKVLQVKVIDNGTALKRAGEAGYELNLNQGRVFGAQNVATNFEGLAFAPSSNAKVLNSTELPITTPLSFTIAAPLTLKVTTSAAKYYVSQNASEDGTTATAVTSAGEEEFDLTVAGTWYIVPSTTSAVKLTNLAFALPKAAKPTIETQPATNQTFGPGNLTATVVATVSDGGTLKYQWYDASNDEEVEGATSATLTTTTEGTYYVIVTNTLADHSDNSVKSESATLGYRVMDDATLSALSASEGTLNPAFDKDVLDYRVDLPEGTVDVPTLSATATMDGYATVNITDATAFVDYEATSTVVVTSEDGTESKTYTVKFYVDHMLPQVDVTESTTWDWTYAAEGTVTIKVTASTEPIKKNEEGLMANVRVDDNKPTNDATFNSQALLFYGENVRAKDGGRWYASLGHIKFNVTKPGIVEVEFSDNGSNNRCLSINGFMSPASSSKTDVKTFKVFVPAGEVTLMGMEGAAPDKYIRISKITYTVKETPDYSRDVTNNIGTLCVDHNVLVGGAMGATFYQIASRNEQYNDKIDFEEVLPNEELKAGEPYIFQSTTGRIDLFYADGDAVTEPVVVRGMHGVLADGSSLTITEENKMDVYYIQDNKLRDCSNLSSLTLVANRAYIVMSEVPTYEQYTATPSAGAPRRRVTLGKNTEQVATGIDDVQGDNVQSTKVLINGQLFIIRGEKMFNANGQLVK